MIKRRCVEVISNKYFIEDVICDVCNKSCKYVLDCNYEAKFNYVSFLDVCITPKTEYSEYERMASEIHNLDVCKQCFESIVEKIKEAKIVRI